MTDTTLALNGLEPLTGTAELGGDYVRFQAPTSLDESDIVGPVEGELTIDGKSERVVLENYCTTEGEGCEITLRRIKPEPR